MAAGLVACYAFGTMWFMAVSGTAPTAEGLQSVLTLCVFPFIIPDAIKIALAVAITKTVSLVKASRQQ